MEVSRLRYERRTPGLATWNDVRFFLEELESADRVPDYTRQSFLREGGGVRSVQDEAVVLKLKDENAYVCADYGEFLVYAPDGSITPKLGLNLPCVAEALRRASFPQQLAGAAYLRWPDKQPIPPCLPGLPVGLLVFSRQTIQMDPSGLWMERKAILHVYVSDGHGMTEIVGADKGSLLRGILRATVRKSADSNDSLLSILSEGERN